MARLAVCALLALPLLGGGWLWLRGSSLVAIEHVHIAGVHGPEGVEVRAALDEAARGMTTLQFDPAALRAALASFPVVASLTAHASFPHTLDIAVRERTAVAVLVGAGGRTAVAADGTVLGPALLSSALPTVAASVAPGAGRRVGEAMPLAALAVLGAAPAALLRFVARVYEGPEGLTAAMRNGLLVYFGDASLPRAKWLSLARVLGSPDARGATYVDVRLPARPAAGFSRLGSSSATASASKRAQAGAAEPTVAAIAESLERAVGGPSSQAPGESAGAAAGSGAQETSSSSGGSREAPAGGSGTGGAEATGPSSEATGPSSPTTAGGSEAPSSAPGG